MAETFAKFSFFSSRRFPLYFEVGIGKGEKTGTLLSVGTMLSKKMGTLVSHLRQDNIVHFGKWTIFAGSKFAAWILNCRPIKSLSYSSRVSIEPPWARKLLFSCLDSSTPHFGLSRPPVGPVRSLFAVPLTGSAKLTPCCGRKFSSFGQNEAADWTCYSKNLEWGIESV